MHTVSNPLRRMRKADKELAIADYKRAFGKSLFDTVAAETKKDRSQVSRTFWGIIKRPDPRVVDVLERELSRLAEAIA